MSPHGLRCLRSFVLATATASLLAACAPAHRQAPALSQVTLPAQWREAVPGSAQLESGWWHAFGDPALSRLVDTALLHNTDALAAAARVDEARALVQGAEAAGRPAVNAAVGAQTEHTLGTSGVSATHALQPELQLSWEIDLWGRLRQQAQAAGLRYQASQAERDGVALSVAAMTAQAYVGLLALEAQLQVVRATAASRTEALRLASDQARVGYSSQLQLTQAQAELEAVQQSIPQVELAIRRQENALRLLVGEMPGKVELGRGFEQLQLPAVPATLPSELLSRRPDIVGGELLLSASDATLAARRSAFLPQVALSASLGSLLVNALDYDPVTVWSLGGSILAPLFSAGRLTAQLDVAAAQRDQAAYAYRGVVLNAFGEVENALSGVTRLRTQLGHAQNRRAILVRSLMFAHDRYQAGYASYLEELDAQRNLYQLEIDLIKLRQSQLDNLIALYRALGGGWSKNDKAVLSIELSR